MKYVLLNPDRFKPTKDPYNHGRLVFEFTLLHPFDLHRLLEDRDLLFIGNNLVFFQVSE